MTKLTRRSVSAIAKIDMTGLTHTRRLDAIARAIGLSDATTMMATLKKDEAQTPATSVDTPHEHYAALWDGATFHFDSFATEAELKVWVNAHQGLLKDTNMVVDSSEKPALLFEAERAVNPELSFHEWFEDSDILYVIVTGAATNRDDITEGVPGVYELVLTLDAYGATPGQLAGAALDLFHASVPISMLEDFEISVHTASGLELVEEDQETSSKNRASMKSALLFENKQDYRDVADPVLEIFQGRQNDTK